MDVRKRILIVDDEENVLFTLRATLAKLDNGADIVTAPSGRQALEKVREMSFDLVLTDLKMPDMDGVAMTEAIRALHAGIVVIWMTAYGCCAVQAEAERLGVYRCLDKPLEVTEIRRIVGKALEITDDSDSDNLYQARAPLER